MNSPPVIPDHTLLRTIGRGAYGEVWLARNIMGTARAVKIIWRRQFESERPYEREFAGIQGYEPVSRTSDGLMQVLHVGRNDAEGYFYYVMELADDVAPRRDGAGESDGTSAEPSAGAQPPGTLASTPFASYTPRTLRADLNRLRCLPIADCVQLALDLVAGLSCLHRHGLVHRDVKPGNIIFVNGRAKLADIGLVSTRNEGRTFVGTEGYIPPEGPGSPAADLYALGMVLYEAATGQPPERFPQTPLEWFARGTSSESSERLEFHEIALKAGEGSRERRYQNVGELQADLALLQSGQSLRRVRVLQRRANLSRRLSLAAAVTVVAAVGSVLFSNYRVRVEAEQRAREQAWRKEAEQARNDAEVAERQARKQLLTALVEQARADVRSGEMGQRLRTLDAVGRAAAITNSPELRHSALAALVLPDLRFDREIPIPPDATMAVLDPAFERFAFGRGTNAVEIRSLADGSILATLTASVGQSAQRADWSHDGRYVAITRLGVPPAWQAKVEIWETPAARRVLTLPPTRYGACSFHPRLAQVVAAHLEDTVGVWDLANGQEVARHPATGMVHHVKFSPDGGSFVVQHRIGKTWFTSLLETSNGKVRSSTPSGWVDDIAWQSQDTYVALAARQGEVYLHDRKTGETSVLGRHKNEARTAVFSPDGAFLFTGGEEQEIICWDLAARRQAFVIAARSAQMQFAGTGARCAIGTRTGLRLHEAVRPAACRELAADLGVTVRRAAFSPDGRWLAVGGSTGLGVWNLGSDAAPTIASLPEHAVPFFSPDSSELFAFNIERLDRWRVEGGVDSPARLEMLATPKTDRVRSGQFSGKSLVLAANGGVLVYSTPHPTTNTARPALAGPNPEDGASNAGASAWPKPQFVNLGSTHASVSSNRKWLVATKYDSMWIYSSRPWAFQRSVPVDSDVLEHAWAPDDEELAVATASGLTFLDTRDWKTQRRLPVALDRHARILFAPDGRSFWLAHDARTAALYDRRTLAPLLPLAPGVLPLAMSPDGNRLLVSIDARRLQLWDWAMLRRDLEKLGLGWSQ